MLNNTFERANLSPFAKILMFQRANLSALPKTVMQRLYSSEQHWEGIIAEVHQTYFPREPVHMHLMPRASSILVLQLQGVMDIQRQSDGRTEQGRIHKGSIFLEPPEAFPTYFPPQETPGVVLFLGLAPSLFEQTVAEMGRHDPTHVEIIKQFNLHDPLIEQIGLALVAELEAGEVAGRLYAESLARTLVLHLLRLSSTASLVSPSSSHNLTPRQIAILRDYMYDRLDQDISLSELATSIGFSVSHFTRLFKQSTGLAPHQYLIACRVERAKSLLRAGEHTIAEVAHAVGFADQSHLNRHFKHLIGVSPGVLCKQSKNVQK